MRAPVPPPTPEPRFRALIDRIGAIVYEAVPGDVPGDAHFLFVSAGAESVGGHPPSRWTEDPRFWLEVVHPDDRHALLLQTQAAIDAMRPGEVEYRQRLPAGGELWVRNVFYPERLPDGSIRLSGVVVDVSPTRRAESRLERLHLATSRLAANLTQPATAQAIAEVGRELAGALAVAVFVRRADELVPLGYDGHAGSTPQDGCGVPVDAAAPVAEAVRTGAPVRLDPEAATRRIPPDDDTLLLRGDGGLLALPLRGGDGVVLGALAVRMGAGAPVEPTEATLLEVLAGTAGAALERVAVLDAERSARRSAEDANVLLESLIATAPEGYALFDRDLRYERVNQALADMNGRSVAEHLGRHVTEVIPDVPIVDVLVGVRDGREAAVDLEIAGTDAAGRPHVWLASYYPVFDGAGEVGWIGAFVVDITARKRVEQRFAQLAELGAILEEGGNVEERLTRVAEALTGTFADFATMYLRRPGDRLERVVTRHVDPEAERLIAANPPSAGALLLSGPQRFDDMSTDDYAHAGADPVARDNHRRIGTRSVLTTPMLLRGENLGVLAVGSRRVAAFDDEDARFAGEVATRAALAVDNARLYAAEREARDRTEGQYAIAAALADALTPTDVAGALLGELLPALDADAGVVWQITGDGAYAEAIGARGEREASDGAFRRVPLTGDNVLTQVLRSRRARWTAGADDTASVYPSGAATLAADGLVATGMVPLLSAGRPVGALFVATRRPGFSGEDHALALTATVQAAQALERATLFETARSTSVTLQRSLLPPSLPAVPGVEIGLRYLPAAGLEAGGDFYEALPVGDDGGVVIAVGDVVGRGATAAAAMGQLRSALRAFGQVVGEPAPVLERLSAFASDVDGAMAATAVVGALLPATGELRYACAGHPWPLLVEPDGAAEYLREGRGVPLGVADAPSYAEAAARLAPGATLLLYTDGLTERRGLDLEVAMERLRSAAAAAAALPLEAMLDSVVRALDDAAGDDVALLAVRLTTAPTDRHLTFAPELGQVPAARAVVRTWLAELGVSGDAAADVLLAAGEAFANAVEHSGTGDVKLSLTSPAPGVVGVEVVDAGTWRPPRAVTSRGRGLPMMRALVDEFDVDSSDDGTRVRLRHAVHPEPAPVPLAPEGPGGCEVTVQGGVARLRGALDMASAATVGARLEPLARGGLTIDLTDVGFLDSTGARLLLELAEAGAVRIVAPPGGASRRTLELSGLDGVLPLVES